MGGTQTLEVDVRVSAAIDELVAYVDIGDTDRVALAELHDLLLPHFGAIAARFYEVAIKNPTARMVIDGPAQVERLRSTLVDWMSTGLRGPYDSAFYEKRSRIGRRHVQIGLAQRYMMTGMSVLRSEYNDRIATLYPPERAMAVMKAVDKLFDVELALMLEYYQHDSEERRVARERAVLNDRLMALQTLVAGLAHEIRNPLNSAKLQLELLDRRVRRLTSDPKLLEPSDLANAEIERLTALLSDFLAFARASDLKRDQHDVARIAQHIIDLERPYANERGVTVTLSAASDSLAARVDAPKLHQVLQNLLRNAIEATPDGGTVVVEVRVVANVLRFRVRDSGTGMSEAIQRRIFEPFFTTKETGTGMGMSIVHSIVTLHGGSIEIASSPAGTTVDVTFPQ